MNEYYVMGMTITALATIIGIVGYFVKLLKTIYDAITANTKELAKMNERETYRSRIIDNHEHRLANHEERINRLEYKKD